MVRLWNFFDNTLLRVSENTFFEDYRVVQK